VDLSPEDAKLVTLARAARARVGATQGAAIRDLDGRTYAAAGVEVGRLSVSALDLAIATAASSASKGLEACAVVTEGDVPIETDVAREFGGAGVRVLVAEPSGRVDDVLST
jgi:hypothetical protein